MAARLLPFIILVVCVFFLGKWGYEIFRHIRGRQTRGDWVIGVFIAIVILILFLSRIAET